jgi:hypothetical protein
MKEEALRLADQLDEDSKYGECDWTYPKVSADMIRKLVAHIEELENPIMQAIAQAFDEPIKPLTEHELFELWKSVNKIMFRQAHIDFARALEERYGIK